MNTLLLISAILLSLFLSTNQYKCSTFYQDVCVFSGVAKDNEPFFDCNKIENLLENLYSPSYTIVLKNGPFILNDKFYISNCRNLTNLQFINVKVIDLESSPLRDLITHDLEFDFCEFSFYNYENTKNVRFFSTYQRYSFLDHTKYYRDLSPNIFANSNLSGITFYGLYNTKLKNNYFSFIINDNSLLIIVIIRLKSTAT